MSEKVPRTCDFVSNEDRFLDRTFRCAANTRIPLASEKAFETNQAIENVNKMFDIFNKKTKNIEQSSFRNAGLAIPNYHTFDGCVRDPKEELGENNPLWCGPGSFNQRSFNSWMLCDEGTWIKEDNEFVCRSQSKFDALAIIQ